MGRKQSMLQTNHEIRVGKAKIKEEQEQKLLGVIITSDLKWTRHVSAQNEKLLHRLYLLRHLKHLLPRTALDIVAKGLFMSQINYCISLYTRIRLSDCEAWTSTHQKLQTAQNQMTRLLNNIKIKDKVNMEKLRTSQGILSINQIACKSTATEMRKCILHDSLPHLQIELSKDKKERKMMTRADTANCIQTPKIHKSMTKDSFSFQGPRIWNNL